LNTVLFPLKSGSMFVTVACLRFSGGDALEFAVAGHLPILRVRGGTVDEITTPQIPIAMFETYPFTASTVDVRAGDLLALITDGLIEVFDAQDLDFGLERAKSLLVRNEDRPLSEIADRLVSAARAHGRQLDDQTLLLIRRT
jgi:sigma-B regulation protein RsbU (phosphoserine phosphatase)